MGTPIAVLGAGAMGGAAARLLARHRDEVDLLVLDAEAARAEAAVREAGVGEARGFDATSGELATILREVRAVAACLPYRLNLPVMEAALAAGCHYGDLGGLYHTTLKQLELDGRFREAGVSAILGIGSAPGITNVLAGVGAARLDRVESIDLVDGAVEEDGDEFGIPYSAETVLDEFSLPAVVLEDGQLREVPAGSGRVDWEFPPPLGVMPAVHTLHSEPATLPRTVEGVRNVWWRLALPPAVHRGFELLASVGLADTEPVDTPSGPAVPREVLLALLARLPAPAGPPRDVEYIDVRVRGELGGSPAAFRGLVKLTPSPEGLSAGAFGTALPITVAARWMAAGRIASGVHPPETALGTPEFLQELVAEGIEVSLSVEERLVG